MGYNDDWLNESTGGAPSPIFRKLIELAYEKCYKKRMLEVYPYLEVRKQLCHPHYCKVVEADKNQRRDGASLELDPAKFERMIEATNPQLKGFFNYIMNAIIPKERSAYNIKESKKSIVGLCYMLAGLRNKFVNQHKLEVGLYLMASGATWEAINTMLTLGYSVCAKTVEEYRKQIQKEHVSKIENHFIENKNLFHVYNIDDYHAIHENRRPDTVSTSIANHFATCVAKPVIESYSVQLTSNGVSVYNPENVEASKICWYLLNVYTGASDISYTDRQSYKISQGLIINTFDPIEMLTIHSYADNIVERKEERSMRGLQLIGFREQHLHSVEDYLNALNIILLINNKTRHLDGQVAPVVADWPGQLFIKKLLHLRKSSNTNFIIPQQIESFLPMLGLLHLSLNSREHDKPSIGTRAKRLAKNKGQNYKKIQKDMQRYRVSNNNRLT
ncbi:hypothetical protein C2G38_2154305 [Gigaspora rosea]|uniref:Uncharacterized protein n=1 Tax=Gigaspora rosea TaxID=44941 RepID=A0A397W6V3_9GLOM|nr:hypothetical protein C2G38_2154305 [Gigaspora rosea]